MSIPDEPELGGGTTEDERTRRNRELIELLNELRLVLPGVQVLFAFLLTVPFTNRFQELSSENRAVFFVCFVATTLSSVMLIAPTCQHRLLWRRGDKERLLHRANAMAIAGTVFLTIAIAAAVYLVTEFVYSNLAAGVSTALLVATTGWFWYGEPLIRRSRENP